MWLSRDTRSCGRCKRHVKAALATRTDTASQGPTYDTVSVSSVCRFLRGGNVGPLFGPDYRITSYSCPFQSFLWQLKIRAAGRRIPQRLVSEMKRRRAGLIPAGWRGGGWAKGQMRYCRAAYAGKTWSHKRRMFENDTCSKTTQKQPRRLLETPISVPRLAVSRWRAVWRVQSAPTHSAGLFGCIPTNPKVLSIQQGLLSLVSSLRLRNV